MFVKGRATHIFVSKLTIIGSDNGLSPGRHQAIIKTSAGILSIGPLGTNFNEILIEILTFSLKKMRLKVSSAKWWPFFLGLNVKKNTGNWVGFLITSLRGHTVLHPIFNYIAGTQNGGSTTILIYDEARESEGFVRYDTQLIGNQNSSLFSSEHVMITRAYVRVLRP